MTSDITPPSSPVSTLVNAPTIAFTALPPTQVPSTKAQPTDGLHTETTSNQASITEKSPNQTHLSVPSKAASLANANFTPSLARKQEEGEDWGVFVKPHNRGSSPNRWDKSTLQFDSPSRSPSPRPASGASGR